MTDEPQIQETTEGQQPTTPTLEEQNNAFAKAEAQASRIEEANAKTEELLERQEALAARNLYAGRSEAGIQPEPVAEMTDQEYANKVLSGDINPMETNAE